MTSSEHLDLAGRFEAALWSSFYDVTLWAAAMVMAGLLAREILHLWENRT